MRRPFSADMFSAEEDVSTLAGIFLEAGPQAIARGREKKLVDHLALIAREFSGQSLLAFRAAWLIVSIRRGIEHDAALRAFFALWDEGADPLCRDLDLRWLVSCADTFALHGRTEAERALGQSASMLANSVKLYESERAAGGVAPDVTRDIDAATRLFDGMTAYSFGRGDVIRNMVSRLDALQTSSPAAALQREVLRRLFAADSVFRRAMDVHYRSSTRPWKRVKRVKRVALLNDTSSDGHYGCLGVMHVIDEMLESAGTDIAYRQYLRNDWRRSLRGQIGLRYADLVIVNGEGSIHHGSKRARRLAAVGRFCRRHGIRSALINASVFEVDDTVLSDLTGFDAIFVRETETAGFLRQHGLDARLATDLTFCLPMRATGSPQLRRGQIFFDSVVPTTTIQLAELAQKLGQPLYVMKKDALSGSIRMVSEARLSEVARHEGRIATLLESGPPCASVTEFRAMVAAAEGVTTGRFHAMCYAILERTPFVAFGSNTRKIESLVADIGLDRNRVLTDPSEWQEPWPFSEMELEAIDVFLWRARSRFDRMRQELFRPF